jgi:hypothetical protein
MRKTSWQCLPAVVALLIRLVLVFHSPCRCAALLNINRGNAWKDLANNLLGKQSPPSDSSIPAEKTPQQILRELDLMSNVEPRPFSVEPSDVPIILGASIPVRADYSMYKSSHHLDWF